MDEHSKPRSQHYREKARYYRSKGRRLDLKTFVQIANQFDSIARLLEIRERLRNR